MLMPTLRHQCGVGFRYVLSRSSRNRTCYLRHCAYTLPLDYRPSGPLVCASLRGVGGLQGAINSPGLQEQDLECGSHPRWVRQ